MHWIPFATPGGDAGVAGINKGNQGVPASSNGPRASDLVGEGVGPAATSRRCMTSMAWPCRCVIVPGIEIRGSCGTALLSTLPHSRLSRSQTGALLVVLADGKVPGRSSSWKILPIWSSREATTALLPHQVHPLSSPRRPQAVPPTLTFSQEVVCPTLVYRPGPGPPSHLVIPRASLCPSCATATKYRFDRSIANLRVDSPSLRNEYCWSRAYRNPLPAPCRSLCGTLFRTLFFSYFRQKYPFELPRQGALDWTRTLLCYTCWSRDLQTSGRSRTRPGATRRSPR
ncbi:hypothetical protein VUR80DRAFT_3628 [Thermomyces stellatus]